jgi:hypothetical protein
MDTFENRYAELNRDLIIPVYRKTFNKYIQHVLKVLERTPYSLYAISMTSVVSPIWLAK